MFNKMDKLDRGFISKPQIQTYSSGLSDFERKVKNQILKYLRGQNNFSMDMVAFFTIAHDLVSVGFIHY